MLRRKRLIEIKYRIMGALKIFEWNGVRSTDAMRALLAKLTRRDKLTFKVESINTF